MELFKREKYLSKIRPFYDDADIIKVITGVRRCGKSSLMQTVADELIDRGISKSNIIFLNLDDIKFRKIKTADLLEKLIKDNLNDTDEFCYLFIDEVQNVDGFEEVINGYRNEGNISIFITGSNSYLLSGELITKLTGRYLEFEMYPLCFDEYISMKKFYNIEVNSNLSAELNNYIIDGGFPRAIFIDDGNAKKTYVKGIVDEIFEKDISRRVKIKDRATFDTVRRFIINNFGSTVSISSIQKALKKNNISVSRETLSKYIKTLLDSKILYECERFDLKSKKMLSGEKKYYLSDLSFAFSDNTDNRINYGPVLENIVYIYAKSKGYSISVGKIGKLECDFILRNSDNEYCYIQVAYTILENRDTEDREYRALEVIKDNYPKYLLTADYLLQKRNGIQHSNIMEFMVNEKSF